MILAVNKRKDAQIAQEKQKTEQEKTEKKNTKSTISVEFNGDHPDIIDLDILRKKNPVLQQSKKELTKTKKYIPPHKRRRNKLT